VLLLPLLLLLLLHVIDSIASGVGNSPHHAQLSPPGHTQPTAP
jgi:hypothetical protein